MLRHRVTTADAGALDLLYHDGERITEAATRELLHRQDGRIALPTDDVLRGTVGAYVLELARGRPRGRSGEVTLDDALGADEAFLTSTTRGVVPIVALDDRPIGDGTVGPITRELMAAWEQVLLGEG